MVRKGAKLWPRPLHGAFKAVAIVGYPAASLAALPRVGGVVNGGVLTLTGNNLHP